MPTCQRCGKEIREDDRFCPYCGTLQENVRNCPVCGHQLRDDENYCAYCGTKVTSSQQQMSTNTFYSTYSTFHSMNSSRDDMSMYEKREEPKEDGQKVWLNWKLWIALVLILAVGFVADVYSSSGSGIPVSQDPTGNPSIPSNGDSYFEYTDDFNGNMQTDMTAGAYYGNLNNGGFVFGDSQFLYAVNNKGELIRRSVLSDEDDVISKDVSGYVQVYQGTLYYTDETNHYLYRVNEDLTSIPVIDEKVYYIIFYQDRIYFQLDEDKESIYSSALDGSDRIKLNDQHSYNLVICQERLYYTTDTQGIWSMALDGSSPTQLSNEHASGLSVVGDSIYFINEEDGLLYHMDIDGHDRKVIYHQPIRQFVVNDNIIYFVDYHLQIGRISNTGEGVQVFNCMGVNLQVVGDYLYFQEYQTRTGRYGDWQRSYKDGSEVTDPFMSDAYQYV